MILLHWYIIFVLTFITEFQRARRYLKQKLDCTTLGNNSLYALSHLSISNNNAPNIDNILHNVSKAVGKFW